MRFANVHVIKALKPEHTRCLEGGHALQLVLRKLFFKRPDLRFGSLEWGISFAGQKTAVVEQRQTAHAKQTAAAVGAGRLQLATKLLCASLGSRHLSTQLHNLGFCR